MSTSAGRRSGKIDRDECGTPEGEIGPCEDALQDAGGVISACATDGHYGEASDSIDDLLDWAAEATAGRGKSTVSPACCMQAARAEFRPCTATSGR